ncbi:MAG: hypothetical protein MUO31_04870 [Thermodesulfovibrionales bacterium]|nr:hypothetical protein [Thermodesulfovibrionales bacterium]
MKQSIYVKLANILKMQYEILRTQEQILRHQKLFFDQLKGSFTTKSHDLLNLPKPLQTTALALLESENPRSATEIAIITGKARAVESHYLNILVAMGNVMKWKDGKKMLFSPLKSIEAKK